MSLTLPDFSEIEAAHKRIQPQAHRTPVLTSSYFNGKTGASLFFKCENFQKIGAFKFRGAFNAISRLSEAEGKKGIVTHSSGNHAQAVALASGMNGYSATIVMPENAPKVKVNAVRDYGAEIIFCKNTTEARESAAQKVIDETGATFIHPYNHPDVIAGQGTAAKELLEDHPDLDIIMAPVGGGGLISGTAIWAKHISPDIKVIGAEPKWADDAYRSFKSGQIEPVLRTDTVADGLRTSLGELTFQAIQTNVDDIVTTSEDVIIQTMRDIWERMKIIIEPSCAVPLAAIIENKMAIDQLKIGIILTGGNVDLENLPFG
ncbi:threonine ammonia-lyase [Rhodohalobacter sp.]|uniref:threonine ammonia-lyase n=1 Tax=Rhodohalobacter sp. TaxID=1974210 RepID=UPI002ACE0B57|nr:pyridoxal-phosphate dependent enzyme [Rhodohalobacter sp.]MDZ7757037.1 pyridoxal-phosphate dependent enzyme [Rhodohalobacter sp.]